MKLNEFAAEKNIPLKTLYNRAKSGVLETYTDAHGVMRIKNTPALASQSLIKKTINIKEIKAGLDQQLHYAKIGQADKSETIKKITSQVKYLEATLNIKLKGYDYKSLGPKLDGKRPIFRERRNDKGEIRNQLLAKNFDKIIDLVSFYYFRDAEAKINTAIDLALYYAKKNEEYWEIAPLVKCKSTLWRHITRHFKESGYPTIHEYLNHYNRFKDTLPRVTGAFTDGDIKFGDYLLGDDHKADVAGVYVYDETLKENVLKQVNIWGWQEPVSMKEWVYCKVGSFTVDDLIYSVIPVILEFGLPVKGITTDNGIANSERWRTFCGRLYEKSGIQGYNYSAPYEPTNKAPKELAHSLWKSEFDAYQKNFVDPHKEDSRHTSSVLSPEAADMYFEDYQKKLESYITGWYLERERRRTINGKVVKISIKDYFNKLWQNHEVIYPTPQQIRWALSITTTAVYDNKIKIGKEQYVDPVNNCSIAFNGVRFTVLYNPRDLNEIDLYALNDFTDRVTGAFYPAGSFITTLLNTRADNKKQEHIFKLQKQIRKSTKELAIAHTALTELTNAMPDAIAKDGEIIETRKQYRKQTETLINQKIDNLPKSALKLTQETSDQQPVPSSQEDYHLTKEE